MYPVSLGQCSKTRLRSFIACVIYKSTHAGADASEVFAQLLVDLAWNSSRLAGNRYSLEAAEELLNGSTVRCDVDTVMLLNHKAAIEFLVGCVPQEGLLALVRDCRRTVSPIWIPRGIAAPLTG